MTLPSTALLLTCCLSTMAFAQSYQVRPGKAMKLPPEYAIKETTGIDAIEGTISKKNGIKIFYDIGKSPRNIASRQKQKFQWCKSHIANGWLVQIALDRTNRLFITFPDFGANFQATIAGNSDLAEVMLIVLTYSPSRPKK